MERAGVGRGGLIFNQAHEVVTAAKVIGMVKEMSLIDPLLPEDDPKFTVALNALSRQLEHEAKQLQPGATEAHFQLQRREKLLFDTVVRLTRTALHGVKVGLAGYAAGRQELSAVASLEAHQSENRAIQSMAQFDDAAENIRQFIAVYPLSPKPSKQATQPK